LSIYKRTKSLFKTSLNIVKGSALTDLPKTG